MALKKTKEAYEKSEGLKCFIISHSWDERSNVHIKDGDYDISPWLIDMVEFLKDKGCSVTFRKSTDERFGKCIYMHVVKDGHKCRENRLTHTKFFRI